MFFMIVDSKNIEFGYELISVLPYAYYQYQKGNLTQTISGNDTACLYYFSPKHTINNDKRSWYNTHKVNYPNIKIHKPVLDKTQWIAPPLKQHYANDRFKFEKETVIICNRINNEWGNPPLNYFNLETLKELFELLQDKYQIIYINVLGRKELYDNADPFDIKDYDLLKQYPKVINIHDLHQNNKELSFNTLQLMLFANCEKYITMNGGHAILSAYFGGENIIMSKYSQNAHAREILPNVNSFYRWYNEFGNQNITHVWNESELIQTVKIKWVKNEPLINILIRTHNRKNYFSECIKSIENQTYKNVNIIVSYENENDFYDYLVPVRGKLVPVKSKPLPDKKGEFYGTIFPYNLYFNEMYKHINKGIVMFLDDDDCLSDNNSLQNIANEFKKGCELLFWRVKCGRLIPNDDNFKNKQIVCKDISGIGFAFDFKLLNFAKWEGYKLGDYRVAKNLSENTNKIEWLNKQLTNCQEGQHFGNKTDKQILINTNRVMEKLKIEIIKRKFQNSLIEHQIGDVIELNKPLAEQYIKHGLAKKVEISKPEPEIKSTTIFEIADVPENPVVEEIKKGRKIKKSE